LPRPRKRHINWDISTPEISFLLADNKPFLLNPLSLHENMDAVLRFNDLASLEQTTMGVGSAGLAVLARAGYFTVRGFVITPKVLTDFLKIKRIADALDGFRSGSKDNAVNSDQLKQVFREERIPWGHEMDLISGFRELAGLVSLVATTHKGSDAKPLYANKEESFLLAVKDCWLRWIVSGDGGPEVEILPAVLVREVMDAEVSVELCRRKTDIHIRAVFGLPEGLADPNITSDVFKFDASGELARIEQKKQEWQYVLGKKGPVKKEIASDFQGEEKATGKMLTTLKNLMATIQTAQKLACCIMCFVGDKPIVYSSDLNPETREVELTLPHREDSLSLMKAPKTIAPQDILVPVIATKLFLKIRDAEDINDVRDAYVEGLLISKKFTEGKQDWVQEVIDITLEAKRRLSTTGIALEISGPDMEELVTFGSRAQPLLESGIQISILLPAIRSMEELRNNLSTVKSHWKGPPAQFWIPIKYPSNLFFMDALAEHSDLLALDLESFTGLMLGMMGEDKSEWMNFSLPILRNAYSEILMNASTLERKVVVLSPDLVASPSLLEFLVREGAEILCVGPEELHTVKHIVASIEKRMLLERGIE
jgi:phosphoenolpyruvate synthase/pyruvate phosphate dikinase